MRSSSKGDLVLVIGDLRRLERPVCFKMEQRFRPLRSPDVRAALRAVAGRKSAKGL